mmetsp:Transcript_18667/g.47709  ORF Transcript_18667/g.47709 Transcript_18667/m.47709 type:complete len:203 (+) Transcript_18667:1563-2171(+)
MSAASSNRAPERSRTALPRSIRNATISSAQPTADAPPSPPCGLRAVRYETRIPPVCAPMRREKVTSSEELVPSSDIMRESSGKYGKSSKAMRLRSRATSRYTRPSVGSSCVSRVAPASSGATSMGRGVALRSRSPVVSTGSLASSSGESCAACAALSAFVSSASRESSSGRRDDRAASSFAASSASSAALSVGSGVSVNVTR